MTLVLAVACADGLVLASDGQATFATSGQPVRAPIKKLFAPWSNVAWGAAGFIGVIQHVDMALRAQFPHANKFERKTALEIRREICDAIARVVRPLWADRFLQIPGAERAIATFLFAGQARDRPFITEITATLADQDHIDTGYAAIGSGDIFPYFALASLAHFAVNARPLREGKLIACRVVQDAINVAAHGLGPPLQMVEIKKTNESASPAAAMQLSDDDLRILQDQVSLWKELEKESLMQFVGLDGKAKAQAAPNVGQSEPEAGER